MKQSELAAILDEWFKSIEETKNFWNQNPVAKSIKSNLQAMKHWKGKKRGRMFGR